MISFISKLIEIYILYRVLKVFEILALSPKRAQGTAAGKELYLLTPIG